MKIYTTNTCKYCKQAKAYLEGLIDLEEIDISDNPTLMTELQEKTGKLGVPVFEFGGDYAVGWSNETKLQLIDYINDQR